MTELPVLAAEPEIRGWITEMLDIWSQEKDKKKAVEEFLCFLQHFQDSALQAGYKKALAEETKFILNSRRGKYIH